MLIASAQAGAPTASAAGLSSWTPLIVLTIGYGVIAISLFAWGKKSAGARGPFEVWASRSSNAIERIMGFPGWAAASIGTALFGLLVAGQGFYSDVAWHIAYGRDDELLTAPHASIVSGLLFILFAAFVGIVFATVSNARVGVRWKGLTVPWSMLPLAALGLASVSGFPLDELWHRQYGIDVTMWSPTHMLMILGASFSGMASWSILSEAGVAPTDSRRARGVHVVAAWLTSQGLVSALGEFSFGVPQFQQLFHPVILCIAAGFGYVAMRIVLGRGWVVGIVVGSLLLSMTDLLGDGGTSGPVSTREGGIYIGSAVMVELVALVLGTQRRLRFALASGLAVGTVGLATEFVYNRGAYQPWTTNLLPDALILGVLAATGAAVVGAAFGRAVAREPGHLKLPGWAVGVASIAILVTLAWPMPRPVGDVTADVRVIEAGRGRVDVEVRLDPPDAADDARWFQTIAWQGGELVLAEMDPTGPGTFITDRPVPIEGKGKVIVRLHRGAEMNAFPIRLPADPAIGEPEVPAVDRKGPFVNETEFLLRETKSGDAWFAYLIYGILAAVALLWIASFLVAARRGSSGAPLSSRERDESPRPLS